VDDEYEREGTANIFMFAEPLSGWREALAHESKTNTDWALEMTRLLDRRCRECEKVILVFCRGCNDFVQLAFAVGHSGGSRRLQFGPANFVV
jgi:hypothetical protein